MRVATYNVENLFSRVRAMATDDPAKSKEVLEDVMELQILIDQPTYSVTDKTKMLKLLKKHKALGDEGAIFLQETRKRLVWKGKIIADGRGDWVGWIEWRRTLIENPAIQNTGRIVAEIKGDVLCMIEVESRPVLRRFNDTVLDAFAYPHAMLIDGNDERGIDVGLLSRFPVTDMRSHVDDPDPDTGKPVFSRDCAEFKIDLPGNKNLWILCNHFKSRGATAIRQIMIASAAGRPSASRRFSIASISRTRGSSWPAISMSCHRPTRLSRSYSAPVCATPLKSCPPARIAGRIVTTRHRAKTIRSITCSSPIRSGRICNKSGLSGAAFGQRPKKCAPNIRHFRR